MWTGARRAAEGGPPGGLTCAGGSWSCFGSRDFRLLWEKPVWPPEPLNTEGLQEPANAAQRRVSDSSGYSNSLYLIISHLTCYILLEFKLIFFFNWHVVVFIYMLESTCSKCGCFQNLSPYDWCLGHFPTSREGMHNWLIRHISPKRNSYVGGRFYMDQSLLILESLVKFFRCILLLKKIDPN